MLHTSPSTRIYKVYMSSSPTTRVFKERNCSSASECQSLEKEASLLSTLSHPCICRIYSSRYWEDAGSHYFQIEMEGFEGTLMQEIKKEKAKKQWFTDMEVARMLWDVGSALAYAQSKQVAHRDVKPENILVTKGRRYTLADFGEGKVIANSVKDLNTIVGTLFYASPELNVEIVRWMKESGERQTEYDPYVSDVYSLGVTAVHMLYPSLDEEPQRDSSHFLRILSRRQIKPALRTLLELMLREDPNLRPNCIAVHRAMSHEFQSAHKSEVQLNLQIVNDQLQSDDSNMAIVKARLMNVMVHPVDVEAWVGFTTKCINCAHLFQYRASDQWRERLFRTGNPSIVTDTICSQACFEAVTTVKSGGEIPNVCSVCNVSLARVASYFFHCKVHKSCRSCKKKNRTLFFSQWRVCAKCPFHGLKRSPFRLNLESVTFTGFEEFAFVCMETGAIQATAETAFPSELHPVMAAQNCHCCGTAVHCFQSWFLIVCGDQANYLCSPACFQSLFPDPLSPPSHCPKCDSPITLPHSQSPGYQLSSWFPSPSSLCHMCWYRPAQTELLCKHSYCPHCVEAVRGRYSDFHCVRCGLISSPQGVLVP